MKKTEETTFEQALTSLEKIVERLEKGELALEESLKLYEEGIRLSRLCHGRLEEAEEQVRELQDRFGKSPTTANASRILGEALAVAAGKAEQEGDTEAWRRLLTRAAGYTSHFLEHGPDVKLLEADGEAPLAVLDPVAHGVRQLADARLDPRRTHDA